MPSDDPTIDQSSGSAGQPPTAPPAPDPTAALAPGQAADDLIERTPAVGVPPPSAGEKTIDQAELDRRQNTARSSVAIDRPAGVRPASSPDGDTAPTVPGYRPIRKLGEGTFGKVWLFEAVHSGKRVAVKFFTHGTTQQWQLIQAEVMQLARLYGDPGIVQLQDLEPDAEPPYCILTYAEGGSLADRLKRGPLPVHEALRVFREAAAALAYVHAKGIIHCDLKPGNVLRDARGRALLADFGQAHLASDLTPALGTFFFMAPEQADLDTRIPDTRWDVYALGALFYAMLTGRPPRDNPTLRDEIGKTPELVRRLRLYREGVRSAPPPAEHRKLRGVDGRLARIIDQCLAADPARRLRDGGAVVDALNRRTRARRQRPVVLFGLLAPLLLLAAAAGTAFVLGRRALHDAEGALVQRRLEDSQVLAQLAANVVEAKLDYRLNLLEGFVRERALRDGLTVRRGEADLLPRRVREFRKRLDEQHQTRGDTDWLFFQLFLADRDGRIVAEDPPDESLHDARWAWRDWFNGEGDRHGEEHRPHRISARPHVSQPYVYRGKGGEKLVIALSVPVKAFPGEEVVGRMVGLLEVKELHNLMDGIGLQEKGGGFVLLNERRHLIYHGLHNDKVPELLPRDRDPEVLSADSPVFRPLPADKVAGADEHYFDPLDHKEYLAGFAPLKKRDWRVVVQFDRATTLEPSRALARWMRFAGFAALVLGGLFVAALYWLLQKTLRRGSDDKVPR